MPDRQRGAKLHIRPGIFYRRKSTIITIGILPTPGTAKGLLTMTLTILPLLTLILMLHGLTAIAEQDNPEVKLCEEPRPTQG